MLCPSSWRSWKGNTLKPKVLHSGVLQVTGLWLASVLAFFLLFFSCSERFGGQGLIVAIFWLPGPSLGVPGPGRNLRKKRQKFVGQKRPKMDDFGRGQTPFSAQSLFSSLSADLVVGPFCRFSAVPSVFGSSGPHRCYFVVFFGLPWASLAGHKREKKCKICQSKMALIARFRGVKPCIRHRFPYFRLVCGLRWSFLSFSFAVLSILGASGPSSSLFSRLLWASLGLSGPAKEKEKRKRKLTSPKRV